MTMSKRDREMLEQIVENAVLRGFAKHQEEDHKPLVQTVYKAVGIGLAASFILPIVVSVGLAFFGGK